MPILTYSQQQAIKPISPNKEREYTQIQLDVERLYLSQLLGSSFAYAVITSPEDYDDLLAGAEFKLCGEIVKQQGLRYVMAYYTFAEYVTTSNVNDTFTGMVQFNRQEAIPISRGQLESIRATNISIAEKEWSLIKEYLCVNSSVYPLWQGQKSQPFTPKMKTIRKTVK
jgi:hypothetical protein